FMYLLCDLPIQKVLRYPVSITHFFSTLEAVRANTRRYI
ncbi:hypothetical protein ACN38_g4524, partial [Penicillium nordicum]